LPGDRLPRRALIVLPTLLAACAAERAAGPVAVQIPAPPPEVRPAEEAAAPARRALATRLDDEPVVAIPRSHPKVGSLRGTGSLSIGTTRDGFVVDCRPLPESDTLKVLEVPARRGTACGTDELVEALVKASRDVAKASPGAVLTAGNIGRAGGGDIIWSISHNSGRDVDIGFYLRGPNGDQHLPPALIHVDATGSGTCGDLPVRFDVRRNWLLVKSLLSNPKVEVQWLFVSAGLKRLLLDHAKKKREPKSLIERADQVMARPRGLSHDDHFHMRLYCAPDDLYEGCQDRGTNRPWFVDRTGRIDARARELLAASRSEVAAVRAAAVTVLGRLGRPSALPRAVEMLSDGASQVRIAAARAIRDLGVAGHLSAVEAAVARVREPEAVLALLQAIEWRLSGEAKAASLGRLLASNRAFVVSGPVFEARWTVGRWALDALSRTGGQYAVRELVQGIGRADAGPAAVARTLAELTGTDAARDETGDEAAEAVEAAWKAWWANSRKKDPVRWWEDSLRADGLLGAGNPSPTTDPAALLDIVRKGDHRRRAAYGLLRARDRKLRLPPDGMEPLPVLLERALGTAPEAGPADVD